ncbi:uncharacterized protein LOC109789889 [Cajanus cajan]|uniref:uncharacterized protein LOC109789889 n=1 Tax=Cajanus cajan TaxID=3821 RepID=UPI0010FBAC56|nr:uncharacterized protein LOC109789889 [Cajanus cajan]
MDKKWTKLPRFNRDYINGVESFLDFAYSKGRPQGEEILCPCAKCGNCCWEKRNVVYNHLIAIGFVEGYNVWVHHGERISRPMEIDKDIEDEEDSRDDIDCLLYDTFRNVVETEGVNKGLNKDARKFYNLIDEAKQELYPGCKNFSTLSFIIRMYLLKCLHGWSNASFTALLELLKEAIPDLNIPETFNKAKSMIRDLGLDYKKIHACRNDCMLYWGDYENDNSCRFCEASRWKEFPQVDSKLEQRKNEHKVPAKILRHFPLIPRLQRLFMCSKTANSMRWHEEERSKDGKLRHPADGQVWNDFDKLHPEFSSETRNVRLGLASDGFNPFRTMSLSHSTWPVMMVVYNFPPWMCMKSEYMMLSLLIPGPQSPGNNIDVYLQPLIEELKELWESGVETYDASRNQTFQMHAALLWTISDYPGYAMLSGWSTKGKLACACCNYNTFSIYLKHSRKMCYMDHRVFLPMGHVWRANKSAFNGKQEHRSAPSLLRGEEILEILKDFNNLFGKTKRQKIDGPWKKKSIFFELPYWAENPLRHNLDVMHIEKNFFDNIIGTLLDIAGKTKDHIKARYDLQEMGIRKNLHPIDIGGGRAKFVKTCFSMTSEEKSTFCGVFKGSKLPDGSASNISRCVHITERKISGYKSHDAHFMLHYLLQIAIRSTMPNAVAHPLIRLGCFFRSLCQKVIQVHELDYLQAEIVEILCQLEMIFPPSFFDIMVHLPIHLSNEVKLGGPVQFRWMYPIERYLCKLKSYVRNRSQPEGSIAEGYLAEEALTLCSRYLHKNVETRLNRKNRNYDNSDLCEVDAADYFTSIGCPLGGKKNGEPFALDFQSTAQAHRYILFNCEEVQVYIREHDDSINSHTKKRKWAKAKVQSQDFSEWFRNRAMKNDVSFQLKELSRGPNTVAKRFSGYLINGYRFHTMKRDARRKTQNSGVTLVSLTPSFASSKDENPKIESIPYYGAITDIIELDYYGHFNFVLFRCDWFEVEEDKYGLICVHFNKRCYQDDPFVLASQVHQCFYIQDPFNENRHYVMKTMPRDVFNMSEQLEPRGVNAPNDDGEFNWVREDIPATIIEKPLHVMQEEEYEEESDFDDTLLDFMD